MRRSQNYPSASAVRMLQSMDPMLHGRRSFLAGSMAMVVFGSVHVLAVYQANFIPPADARLAALDEASCRGAERAGGGLESDNRAARDSRLDAGAQPSDLTLPHSAFRPPRFAFLKYIGAGAQGLPRPYWRVR